jgi:hypothetical protein
MGLNLGFFNNPKHRVFDYQPLYYNPRKEALDEKIRAAKEGQEHDKGKDRDYMPGKNIRGKIQQKIYYNRRQAGSPLFNRVIVFVTLIVFIVVLYYIAKGMGSILQ